MSLLVPYLWKDESTYEEKGRGMALAARIASPQGVAFHTSTNAAPAERGARRPSLGRRKEPRVILNFKN